jgi:DNA-binding transcriptional ArsR family regulator
VQTNGGTGFTTLSPRQPLYSVPYAITANSANNLLGTLPASQLSGTVPKSMGNSSATQWGIAETNNKNFFQLFHLPDFSFRLIFNHMVKYGSRLDDVFGALADPTRRRILETLSRGDQCVTALARPHRMSLPAISKHLRVLEHAGLICRRRDGRVHHLKLDAKSMQQAAQWIEEYRKFWEGALDSLANYLEKTNQTTEQVTKKKGKS